MPGITELIVGAASVAGSVALTAATGGAAAPLLVKDAAGLLMGLGSGLMMSGVGSLIEGSEPVRGFATATRNPIHPWVVANGRLRTGGSVIIME